VSYQALYRVWRPQNFHDVVGQEHITKTLQNAILENKISHAYLFTGPRGTGKTSAAKIFSKAVNCQNGPALEPCNECAICQGITNGSIPDVIEIDAASNNGVEEIRDIRDKVKYTPNVAKYKVYIIDEVHMLSIGAFNALLKTLEEPPQHVIFILATTEPHKIPLTIISRCQRFDFKRISAQNIAERMKFILNDYGYTYEEEALKIIANAAEGGMRDALSLLDQTISFSENQITVEDALTITGSVSQQVLNELANAIVERDTQTALTSLNTILASGKDSERLIEDLIQYYRDLLLYKNSSISNLTFLHLEHEEEFSRIAKNYNQELIFKVIDQLNRTQQEMKFTNHPVIFLEVCFVQLCQLNPIEQENEINRLKAEIEELKEEINRIKELGLPERASSPVEDRKEQRPVKSNKGSYKAPVGKIENVLSNATKQNLKLIKEQWGNLIGKLKKSHSALLNDAEPVAASSSGCIIKFKYEIHCQMAMNNAELINVTNQILSKITGQKTEIIGIPEDQWLEIRNEFLSQHRDQLKEQEQTNTDPFIDLAKQLVGEELLEIKE